MKKRHWHSRGGKVHRSARLMTRVDSLIQKKREADLAASSPQANRLRNIADGERRKASAGERKAAKQRRKSAVVRSAIVDRVSPTMKPTARFAWGFAKALAGTAGK